MVYNKTSIQFVFCSEKTNKQIDKENATDDTHFYGPATNCNELGKLGYTLNGYYLVKGNGESYIHQGIEVVFCRFQLPPNSKSSKNLKASQL